MGPSGGSFHGYRGWVVSVPPERSADLRRYYAKHTKNDRLGSHVLARLPLLHPDGLNLVDSLGPADGLKRAVRRRVKLVEYQLASRQRLDSMLDLLGPGYAEALGGARYTKTALQILEDYGNPRKVRRLGVNRLTVLMRGTSGGQPTRSTKSGPTTSSASRSTSDSTSTPKAPKRCKPPLKRSSTPTPSNSQVAKPPRNPHPCHLESHKSGSPEQSHTNRIPVRDQAYIERPLDHRLQPMVGCTSPGPPFTFRTPVRHPVSRVSDTLSAE
jgi:hypothetical protein